MVIKTELGALVKKFNASSKGVKAKLADSTIDTIKVSFSGDISKESGFAEKFLEMIEGMTGKATSIKQVAEGKKEKEVTYVLGDESPADKILNILMKYNEGTPPVQDEFED